MVSYRMSNAFWKGTWRFCKIWGHFDNLNKNYVGWQVNTGQHRHPYYNIIYKNKIVLPSWTSSCHSDRAFHMERGIKKGNNRLDPVHMVRGDIYWPTLCSGIHSLMVFWSGFYTTAHDILKVDTCGLHTTTAWQAVACELFWAGRSTASSPTL